MTDFDWSPGGYAWYAERQSLARANERQMRFSAAYRRHGNASLAAKESGYSGTDETLRQAGHRAVHSAAVVTLLGLMDTEDEAEVVNLAELKRIFSRAARSGSTSDRVKAGEALLRLGSLEEKQRERSRPKDPKSILAELAKIDVFIADYMSRKYWGVPAETYLDGFDSEPAVRDDDAEGIEKMEGTTA